MGVGVGVSEGVRGRCEWGVRDVYEGLTSKSHMSLGSGAYIFTERSVNA
jgi:hypothetical protein